MGYVDRVRDTTNTTGTGSVTLNAAPPSGFQAFGTPFAVNDPICYTITDGTNWEVGEGYLSSSTVLVRDRVLRSSNADALVNFGAGPKDVFCTLPADNIADSGVVAAGDNALIVF